MLSTEENDLLTQVGHDTLMGRLHRQHWVAAMMSSELHVPSDRPVALRILGEDLVAFRDDNGIVGVMQRACPHRGASLTLARHEGCGLRCIYHGWMVGTKGDILETPNEPLRSRMKERVRHEAYPVVEAGGFVWIYMGDEEDPPPLPRFEWLDLPTDQVVVEKFFLRANWLQALEGSLDSSHSNYLHSDIIRSDPDLHGEGVGESPYIDTKIRYRPTADGRPRLEVHDEPYGFRYVALRDPMDDPEHLVYARTTVYVAPAYVLIPQPMGHGLMPFYVPVDDTNTVVYIVRFADGEVLRESEVRELDGVTIGQDVDENFNRFRNPGNHWLQDRAAILNGDLFCGINGIASQDAAVVESMGPIFDRTKEHVGAADLAVIHLRKLLLNALRELREKDIVFGLQKPVEYFALRAWQRVIARDVEWEAVSV